MGRGFFITGTDTGIGKTVCSCALLHAFAGQGLKVIGLKPIASGAEIHDGKLRNDDALQLQHASNILLEYEQVNPYCFAPPVAPVFAAEDARTTINLESIKHHYNTLVEQADIIIVEGVGGWHAPLTPNATIAHLAQLLNLPVILVSGIKLGGLSHTLLTADAIDASRVPLAGWIANDATASQTDNKRSVAYLEQRIEAPLLGHVPWLNPPDTATMSGRLNVGEIL